MTIWMPIAKIYVFAFVFVFVFAFVFISTFVIISHLMTIWMTIAQIFVPIQHYRDDCVCLSLFNTPPVALSVMTMVWNYHNDDKDEISPMIMMTMIFSYITDAVTCESLVSREFSRTFWPFHFSISISRHFHFTFHFLKRVNQIFISLFTSQTFNIHSRRTLLRAKLF